MFSAAPAFAAKATLTGNPVRAAVVDAAAIPYPALGASFRILVFGGSQGARVMADVVPAAIGSLDPELRARIAVTQQARDEDLGRVREAYAKSGVAAETASFFADLPARIAASHLVIGRSGARPSPSFRRSGGLRFWCRCRAQSIRINSPMPACLNAPAARSASPRMASPPTGSPRS